ncbi:hypothetical protein L9F63_022835, partial [Diploptera punctata]
GAVRLSVYYESLCPDSIRFIKYQLHPTYLLLGNYMHVDFVPYGKASQSRKPNGGYSFQCQHGPNECKGNMQQACALSLLPHNATTQVQFVSCVMSSQSPPNAGRQCANILGIDYNAIASCANSTEGQNLLAALGNRTHSVSPKITFIPTIVFNGVYTQTDQDDSMDNLLRVVCRHIVGTKPAAFEKIPDQGVGRAVKHGDSCLEEDKSTIHEFVVSVLSEDESNSNSSSNDYLFDECDSSPVSKRILLQPKPVNSKASDVDLNEQGVSDCGGRGAPDETCGKEQLFDWN